MDAALVAAALLTTSRDALAQATSPPPAPPVDFHADEVRLDTRSQELDAVGHVQVDEPPFHLTSEELRLRRVPIGAELIGDGRVAFCPCLGTPLALRFSGAIVAPPHDLIVRQPVLEVFGVPIAWAPVMWLRSPGRVGLLPPDVAWRGEDGFFAGGGVHVPWVAGDTTRGLDLRAGGYAEGGVAIDTTLRTMATSTRVRWDRLHGDDGVTLDARGATSLSHDERDERDARIDSVAWEVGALRGARAVRSTTDLDAAARPFDRAAVEASWRPGGWTIASGVRAVADRGGGLGDVGSAGPVIAIRRADAIGPAGDYDATLEGGAITGGPSGTTSFARGEGGVAWSAHAGPVGASIGLRGVGDVADDGAREGTDGAAEARATITLPLARAYASADDDPWVHRTEPRVAVAALATRTSDVFVAPAARGMTIPDGGAWMAAGGWSNAIGRRGSRTAAEVDVAGGAVGDTSVDRVLPLLRGRASATGDLVGLRADFARVLAPASSFGGGALLVSGRVGSAWGPSLAVHAAERDGVDPRIARVLVDAPLEPSSGFLAAEGWTGGARVAVPFGARVTARGGGDVDFGGRELVAVAGALELHDPCGCVVLRASAAHRIGREGVDVWITVDVGTNGR